MKTLEQRVEDLEQKVHAMAVTVRSLLRERLQTKTVEIEEDGLLGELKAKGDKRRAELEADL